MSTSLHRTAYRAPTAEQPLVGVGAMTHERAEQIAAMPFDWVMAPIGAVADAFFSLFIAGLRHRRTDNRKTDE